VFLSPYTVPDLFSSVERYIQKQTVDPDAGAKNDPVVRRR